MPLKEESAAVRATLSGTPSLGIRGLQRKAPKSMSSQGQAPTYEENITKNKGGGPSSHWNSTKMYTIRITTQPYDECERLKGDEYGECGPFWRNLGTQVKGEDKKRRHHTTPVKLL